MARNLDASMAAALSSGLIQPFFAISLALPTGPVLAWSGVGDLVWNGLTFKGIGNFGKISAIAEGTDVEAAGITVQLAGVPWGDPAGFVPDPGGATNASASMAKFGQSIGCFDWGCSVTFSVFEMASTLPADAVIQGVYPVLVGSFQQSKCDLRLSWGPSLGSTFPILLGSSSTEIYASSAGNSLAALNGQQIWVEIDTSGAGGLYSPSDVVEVTAAGFAVYYTSATPSTSALIPAPFTVPAGQGVAWAIPTAVAIDNPHPVCPASAIVSATPGVILGTYQQIAQGSPAKLWFGLLSGGAIIGTPYLVFSGVVDQPTIDIDEKTISYTIALESRMTNLNRPTARRYTAADQRLFYPDDIGFNWVEPLNDAAFRWGG